MCRLGSEVRSGHCAKFEAFRIALVNHVANLSVVLRQRLPEEYNGGPINNFPDQMRAFAQPAHADAQRADLQRRLARVVLALQNYFVDREDCPQGGALLVQVGARGRAPARVSRT